MINNENRIDELFESARHEAPIRSFASSKSALLAGTGTTTSIGVLAKWAKLSFTFKTLIMVGIIGTVATCVVMSSAPNETLKPSELIIPQEVKTEVVDEKNEVVVHTTYFDTEKDWVEISIEPLTKSTSDTVRTAIVKEENVPKTIDPKREIAPPSTPLNPEDTTTTATTTMRTFLIERNSSDVEIEKIRKEAEAAGIEFKYKILVWKGKIKRCSIHVYFNNGKGGSCEYKMQLSGKFSKRIGWVEDENGKAISFDM
jgi:hypothetical protein